MNTHDTRRVESTTLAPLHFSNGEFDLAFQPDGVGGYLIPAAPVAKALGFRDAYRLTETIPDNEKGYTTACTPGGDQRVLCLTLPGLFRAISQRQAARIKDPLVRAQVERFQAWNFGTVLPSIATTGSYSLPTVKPAAPPVPALPEDYETALERLLDQVRETKRVARELEASQAQVAEMEAPARAWHGLVENDRDGMSMEAASKVLRGAGARIGDQEFPRYLAAKGMIHRSGHTGRWTTNRPAEDEGYVTMKMDTGVHKSRDGSLKPNPPSVRVLTGGMEYLLSTLTAERGSTKHAAGQTAMALVIR